MSHVRREKQTALTKESRETRWDRIRKRHHTNAVVQTLKTGAIKRFIEMDFIGKHQNRIMNGFAADQALDPILVMNLRHEIFKKIPQKKLNLTSAVSLKNSNSCIAHNINVEDHYLENQLQRFREHLKKEYQRRKIPKKQLETLLIDNKGIMKSFNLNEKCLRELYKTPVEVLNEVNDLYKKCNIEEENYKEIGNDSEAHVLVSWKEENRFLSGFIVEKEEKISKECEETQAAEEVKEIIGVLSNEIYSITENETIQKLPSDDQKKQSYSKGLSQILSDVKDSNQGLHLGTEKAQQCTKEVSQLSAKLVELDLLLPLKEKEVIDDNIHPETEEIELNINLGNKDEESREKNNLKDESLKDDGSHNLKEIIEDNTIITFVENIQLPKSEKPVETGEVSVSEIDNKAKQNVGMPSESDEANNQKHNDIIVANEVCQLSMKIKFDEILPITEKENIIDITDEVVTFDTNDLAPSIKEKEDVACYYGNENSSLPLTLQEKSTELRCEVTVVSKNERNSINLQILCNDSEKEHEPPHHSTSIKVRLNSPPNNNQEHRCVSFDETVAVCNFSSENSCSSHTCDAIESVISDLAEEAVMEVKEEGRKKCQQSEPKQPEMKDLRNGLTLKGCSLETQSLLMVTGGKMPSFCEARMINEMSFTAIEDRQDSSPVNEEQKQFIEKLFQLRSTKANLSIMRKYFIKWMHFRIIEKIERENLGDCPLDRVKKINIFLDKVRFEKDRLNKSQKTATGDGQKFSEDSVFYSKKDIKSNVIVAKKYQNKIKVQQDIIDLQRIKLERQERIIMELKLGKLSEETKEARQGLKEDLKSVIRSGNPKLKVQAKTLQLVGNLKDREDNRFERLEGKALEPAFLKNMQERAMARSIRQEQARLRRLQIEAEKEAQKLAVEEAKRLEGEEAKRLRMEAWNEKRRQERMAKILKERERQKAADNLRKAQEFCRRLLLSRIGMEGFKRLLEHRREKFRKYQELRLKLNKKRYLQAWFAVHCIAKARRDKKADEFYESILKRRIVNCWCCYVEMERCKVNVADDWYDFKLVEGIFRKWWGHTKRMRIIEESKIKQASSHHDWQLKWKVLDCWRRLKQMLQLERETEERRQKWRIKIWELIPDYTPVRDGLEFI
uniref:Sfi1 spindle body domain-containing protein n=1 Tax=Glossina brevipalpis TaxID=37001 RepID=A0A1A9W6L5_9MUSC